MNNNRMKSGLISNENDIKSSDRSLFAVELSDNAKTENIDQFDYNPYDNREVEHPTTNAETLLHLLKGSLGTGILAMPMAFVNAGWLLGLIGTIVIGFLCTYCVHLLINAEYELCKRRKVPSMNYPTTAEAALREGPDICKKCAGPAQHIVNVFLVTYELGTCCVYVVFIGTNVKDVMDNYIAGIDVRIYMLVFLLPLILLNWIRKLKYLAPFSTIANGITVVSFGVILYYVFQKGPTFENKNAFGEVQNLPLFFGTVLFALESIGVIMPLENEMKTPESFGGMCGVLNIGMVIIVGLYILMGFLGYLAYGIDVKDSITLSIEKTEILGQVVRMTLALAIYLTHSLLLYVAFDITWNEYLSKILEKNNHRLFWELVVRTFLVLITFLLAVAIPNLGMIISLFGALCLSTLGIALPALIDLCTFYHSYTGFRFKMFVFKNILIMVFSVFGLIVGTYTSIAEIIKGFQ